eukprot:jgi/Bigna1/84417/fgenesh1_pg.135_\
MYSTNGQQQMERRKAGGSLHSRTKSVDEGERVTVFSKKKEKWVSGEIRMIGEKKEVSVRLDDGTSIKCSMASILQPGAAVEFFDVSEEKSSTPTDNSKCKWFVGKVESIRQDDVCLRLAGGNELITVQDTKVHRRSLKDKGGEANVQPCKSMYERGMRVKYLSEKNRTWFKVFRHIPASS